MKSKYKPYATRKQQKSRQMRNVALVLIVLIVAIAIFNKRYRGDHTIAAETNEPKAQLNDVLPSGQATAQSDTSDDSGPLVVWNPAVASAAETQPVKTQPESAPVETFSPPESLSSPQEQSVVAKTQEAVVQPETASVVSSDATDASSQEAKNQINEALRLRDAGKVVAAREMLENTLNMQLSPTLRSAVKLQLAKLAETWLFGREVILGDKLTGYYEVKRGDNLERIAKEYKVTPELLMRINGIARPELLPAGKAIKVVNGPFNVVVYKSNFTMDLYLQNRYVKTYRVGLGRVEHETPSGTWRVEPGGKLISPTWTDPDTNHTYVASDPDYPLGSRWIAIEGTDDVTRKRDGFAIHGTKDPDSIGKRSSRGCIRLYNGDVIEVYNLLYGGISEVLIKD